MILKKIKWTLLLIIMVAMNGIGLISCGSDESEESEEPEIIISGNTNYFVEKLVFDSSANEKTISFLSNVDWSLSVSQGSDGINWCTVSPISGKAGSNNIVIRVNENTTYVSRNAVITFTASSKTYRIEVFQHEKKIDDSPVVLFVDDKKVIEGNNLKVASENSFVASVKDNTIIANHIGQTSIIVNDNIQIPVTVLPKYKIMSSEPILDWGLSKAEVKSRWNLGTLSRETNDILAYNDCDNAALVAYTFKAGKLDGVSVAVPTSKGITFTKYLTERFFIIPNQKDNMYVGYDAYSLEEANTTIVYDISGGYKVNSEIVYICTYMPANQESETPPQPDGEAKGDGTLANPFNATAANAYASALGSGEKSDKDVYIKGKIISIEDKNQFNTQYGNCTFYISDDGTDNGDKFYVFRTLYLENVKYTSGTLPKAGDEVIICGKVMNYMGNTPETSANESYIYSLNGKTEDSGDTPNPNPNPGEGTGSGTLADPYNSVAANAVATALGEGNTSSDSYYIKGKVVSIALDKNGNEQNYNYGTYGNATFYISDDGTENGQFYVYRALYLGNKKWEEGAGDVLKPGDEVIVCGKLTNYNGTPETKQGETYLYSLNGKTN